ncbi:MAG: ATP-binding protein [Succinivibrio sp.]|nr:ATP-binding protein [Succinivibrio sp.]
MNHELLKEVIQGQQEVIKKAQIVPRDHRFNPEANYVLCGIRRAGKSTLLYQRVRELVASGCKWEQIIFVNFEDDRLLGFDRTDFDDLLCLPAELGVEQAYFFFDEIQNIPGWERFARRLADRHERVFITGSNAAMLSTEIASALGGRYLIRKVWPYSFVEYLQAAGMTEVLNLWTSAGVLSESAQGRIQRALLSILYSGSLPEILRQTDHREYLHSLLQRVLLGDVVLRHQIRQPQAIRYLAGKIAEAVGRELSYTRLHNLLNTLGLKLSKETVIDYVSYCLDACVLFKVTNFYSALAEREGNPKYYFEDNGLLGLFLHRKEGMLLENLVGIALYRCHGADLYFVRSARAGFKVDFYVPSEGLAVQVSWMLEEDNLARELGGLVKLKRAVPELKRAVVVTCEEERVLQAGELQVEVLPAWKFLLHIESESAGAAENTKPPELSQLTALEEIAYKSIDNA